MFEKFSEEAIGVIVLAQGETRRSGHTCVGTEHILLGLIAEEAGVAGRTSKSMGLRLKDARAELEKLIESGPGIEEEIPFTTRAKMILHQRC